MTFTDLLLKLKKKPKPVKPKIDFAQLIKDYPLPSENHTTHVHVGIPHQDFGAHDFKLSEHIPIEHMHALENALFFGSKAYSSSVYPVYDTTKITWLEDTFMPNTFSKLLTEEKTIEANDRNNGTWQPNTPA